jgi:hypothetical protein
MGDVFFRKHGPMHHRPQEAPKQPPAVKPAQEPATNQPQQSPAETKKGDANQIEK